MWQLAPAYSCRHRPQIYNIATMALHAVHTRPFVQRRSRSVTCSASASPKPTLARKLQQFGAAALVTTGVLFPQAVLPAIWWSSLQQSIPLCSSVLLTCFRDQQTSHAYVETAITTSDGRVHAVGWCGWGHSNLQLPSHQHSSALAPSSSIMLHTILQTTHCLRFSCRSAGLWLSLCSRWCVLQCACQWCQPGQPGACGDECQRPAGQASR